MKKGTIVKLKERAMLGVPVGTRGVVYDTYDIGWGPGVSVIFPNGNHDGFSQEEQNVFLDPVGFDHLTSQYNFINVMKLHTDFEKGLFNQAF
jgi:hypothetical protein